MQSNKALRAVLANHARFELIGEAADFGDRSEIVVLRRRYGLDTLLAQVRLGDKAS